jgi:hypothetical protein
LTSFDSAWIESSLLSNKRHEGAKLAAKLKACDEVCGPLKWERSTSLPIEEECGRGIFSKGIQLIIQIELSSKSVFM